MVLLALTIVSIIAIIISQKRRSLTPYQLFITSACKEFGVENELCWAVIWAESAGNERAVSRKGAIGLMQIMPKTGLELSEEVGFREIQKKDLFEPALNIRLGVYYLSKLARRFNDDLYLTLAAYNAGPNKVAKWIKAHPEMSSQKLIKKVAFTETRKYVFSVLKNREYLKDK